VHLSCLEVTHFLLLTLLTGLLPLLAWHWAIPCKVTRLPAVVAR